MIQFIVEADEPALFFNNKSSAERSLEAFDVEEGTYPIAFDRSGRIYNVVPYNDRALLVPDPQGRSNPERLKNTLKQFLRAVNVQYSADESLESLLAKCEEHS